MRLLQTPTADMKGLTIVAPILKGGTGADNSTEAVQNLGGINAAFLGQANGVAQLNALGKLDLESFPAMVMVGPTLNGPTTIYTGQTVNYTITNYDINTVYDISASVGTVNRVGDTLTYTAPGTVATLILTVNSKTVTLPIIATIPNAPEIVSPVDGSIGLSSSVVITASAFSMNTGSDTHQSSDWQIATDNGFSNIVSSVTNDTVNKLSWTANGLAANMDYYVRVRYKGTAYGYGSWSETISFTTKLSFIPSTETAILTASDKAAYDQFGTSISISSDGSRVAIGVPSADPNTLSSAGKAYIFSRSGTSWTEEAILTASDKAAGDNFGISVSISSDGSRVAIGAQTADPNTLSNAGKAYIFSRSGTSWTEEAILTASDKAASDYFGQSVSISSDGSRVAIAAQTADPSLITNAGKAYIFS